MTEHHVPVLLYESIEYLVNKTSGLFFDGTLGFGGHSSYILKNLDEKSKLIVTDKDINAINYCKNLFSNDKRVTIYNTSFTDIRVISNLEGGVKFDGIFADLGVSSFQLDDSKAGFTYRMDSPLDLRMNKTEGISAGEVINTFKPDDIANIIYKYGEEKKSRQIAARIDRYRKSKKIETTFQLKEIIAEIVPEKFLKKTLSRVFQALRIYVNDELEDLKKFLDVSVDLLNPGGRLVILTYHSLEDRIVKEFIQHEFRTCICPIDFPICKCDKVQTLKKITRKPVVPSKKEVEENRRSRSAKLRAAERL